MNTKKINYKIIISSTFIFALFFSVAISASATTFAPGETLDPTCSPVPNDCYVEQVGFFSLPDNQPTPFYIREGLNNYLNIDTSNGLEKITFGNATTNPDFEFLGSGLASFAGSVSANSLSVTGLTSLKTTELRDQSSLFFGDFDSSAFVGLRSPGVLGASFTLTLPDSIGTNGQLLSVDGAGQLLWSDALTGLTNNVNTFLGVNAGISLTAGTQNLLLGNEAGTTITTGDANTILGYFAGVATDIGNQNVFIGRGSAQLNTSGSSNIAIGIDANSGINGSFNTVMGHQAGINLTSGDNNILIGDSVGTSAANDSDSIAIGRQARTSLESIAFGFGADTNGRTQSIALGKDALNTDNNQFMIGSATSPINDFVITGAGFTTCSVNLGTGNGIACSSDERLKTNIEDLESTLPNIANIRTINYNWKSDLNGEKMIGFSAQDLQNYYPGLVSVSPNGYLQVNYAGITPILTKGIQEIYNLADSFKENITSWFANASNGITDFFAQRVRTETLCVGTPGNETCITKDQLDSLLSGQQVATGGSSSDNSASGTDAVTDPEPSPSNDPTSDTNSDSEPAPEPDPMPESAPEPASESTPE